MLKIDDLKIWLQRDLRQLDKLLLILATFDSPCQLKDIVSAAADAGLRINSSWNPSATLMRSKGLAIRLPDGWEISETGKQHLRNLGVTTMSPAAMKVATDLRLHLVKIRNANTKVFVEEAIKCHEAELYRAAVVMSWLAAVDVLHQEVVTNHLTAFNAEAKRIDAKWKTAKTTDDLGRMGEDDFLNRLAAISVLGKNAKEELLKCLKLRNGAGHPNSLKVGQNMVASHLETLLLNVFEVFNP
ncbi:hypothetical protein Q1W73_10450 [Asticcacaulis sp. ZE23SCel15]|uniref:hypothetical protein n=1 Tax=Asticcacaulis sp. ZE23SCel15 TaxID=3059027 RepID=UPI00265F32BF|nr:hypothetical protein [Asticcacaulis sp. ZE23SCel15]WKL56119.1 hypothetical protein Q1W73_10450 [Asticcacaulis sp. ZE23SCel15]